MVMISKLQFVVMTAAMMASIVCWPPPLAAQQAAQMQGRVVVAGTRAPVAGATVSVLRVDLEMPESTAVRSGPDGSFVIPGLAAGDYQICAEPPRTELASPCNWSPPLPPKKIAAGEQLTGIVLNLLPAKPVAVVVNDAAGVLEMNEGKTAGVSLLVGVWSPAGAFYPARLESKAAGTRTYRVHVPFDIPVMLDVKGHGLLLEDAAGQRVAITDAPLSFTERVSATTEPKQFQYAVRGLAP